MVGQAPTIKVPPKKAPGKKRMTMQGLWRMTLWGATAASTLLVAVLTTRSEVGSQRVAVVVSSISGSLGARPFDAQAETRRLAEAVRGLAADNDQLKSRVASVERNMDDMTGSITRQIQAAKSEPATPPWPADASPLPVTPATLASIVAPAMPPAPPPPVPPSPSASPSGSSSGPAAAQEPAEAAPAAAEQTEYGADLGSAVSIQVLRDRWLGIRAAHADLFQDLAPTVVLRKISRLNRVELRLIVGPLANREAAAQLCASLEPFRLPCQPTVFDREHLALR